MKYVNNTGSDVTISWCVETHWGELGAHDPDSHPDCILHEIVVADGAEFEFDENTPNGDYIMQQCTNAGLE